MSKIVKESNKELNKEIIVLSDLHIGAGGPLDSFELDKKLISFLDSIQGELIINGDFLDFWAVKDSFNALKKIILKHRRLFKKFKDVGKKHNIIVIPGNHDHELMYNKKYRDELKKYNITVIKSQTLKFKILGKNITFDHGSQFDPICKVKKFGVENTSFSEHFYNLFIKKIILNTPKDNWIRKVDNVVPRTMLTKWIMSKYYYYEMGGPLKLFLLPIFALLGIAQILFIPVLLKLFSIDIGWISKVNDFIDIFVPQTIQAIFWFFIIVDFIILSVILGIYFIKKDILRRIKKYELDFDPIVNIHKGNYETDITKASNADAFIFGHNHMHLIENIERKKDNIKNDITNNIDDKINDNINNKNTKTRKINKTNNRIVIVNTGTWKQKVTKIKAHFRLPSVYVHNYKLTYAKIFTKDKKVILQLRQTPYDSAYKLNLLEKIAVFSKKLPTNIKKDVVLGEEIL